MQPGKILSSDVTEWISEVIIEGKAREVDSWKINRSITSGLPDELSHGGSELKPANGMLTISKDTLQVTNPSPFNKSYGWVPKAGDTVIINLREKDGDGSVFRAFTGYIDDVSGTVGESIEVDIVGEVDSLSKTYRREPRFTATPGNKPGSDYIYTSLTSLTVVDDLCMNSGHYSTYPVEANMRLHVPLQGSTKPYLGEVLSSRRKSTSENENYSRHPQIALAPWGGYSMNDFTATYGFSDSSNRTHNATEGIQLVLMSNPKATGSSRLTIYYAEGNISLNINGNNATAYVNNQAIVSTKVTDTYKVSLYVSDYRVSIATDSIKPVEKVIDFRPSGDITRVLLDADSNSALGGASVMFPMPSQKHISLDRPQTAILDIRNPATMSYLSATRSYMGDRTTKNILEELAQSKLASLWFDEYGNLNFANNPSLEVKPSSHTLTTLDDILSMQWTISAMQTAGAVNVIGSLVDVSLSSLHNILLYQADNMQVLRNGDILKIFMEPPSNETWGLINRNMVKVGYSEASFELANDMSNSLYGMYFTTTGLDSTFRPGSFYTARINALGHETTLLEITARDIPPGVEGVLAIPEDSTYAYRRHRGKGLPRLVGGVKARWRDTSTRVIADISQLAQTAYSATYASRREITHDAGVWSALDGGDYTIIERLANYLKKLVENPQPVVSNLRVSPDPRVQLGDVLTISSTTLLGAKFTALVQGVSMDFSNSSGLSQELTIRVLTVDSSNVTYEAWQEALLGGDINYEQYNMLAPAELSYSEFNKQLLS